ncbi:capsular biosynthesis protein [Clostridium sp. HMb25]|nr:capsular biosynthesis protein [Clostridium sp. HMb25]
MRLIIPSATLIPEELQGIGQLPAIIYPVNQKIVFDYLYFQYKDICEGIKVVCCKKVEKVQRRLHAYNDKRIEIKTLDTLGSLADTIYYGIKDVDQPIIINFSDTIVFDNIYNRQGDTFFYSMDYLSGTWTYYDIENGKLTNIYDKVESNSEDKKKLFVGVFQIFDTSAFAKCLKKAIEYPETSMSAFYNALVLYSQEHPFTDVCTTNWFDIGHADTYFNSRLEVKAREFNHIEIDRNRGILTKYSDDKDKFIDEIKWYLKLPQDIEYVRPRIYSYSTSYIKPYVSMEYYAYHTLHELFLYGDLSKHRWIDIFCRINFVCNDFRRYRVKDGGIKSALEDIYLTKTVQRLNLLKVDSHFENFFNKNIIVNGVTYKSLDEIDNILQTIIPKMLYDIDEFNIIHGDLCFTNIMVDNNFSFIKLIDPRGKFGSYDLYGDFRYELAKLFHSVDGKYDYIIKDLFTIDYDLEHRKINFQISTRVKTYELYDVLLTVFQKEVGNNLKKIELIEALLFLSMIPLHKESFNHQLVMLGTGVEILNRVVNIKMEV